jgi:hypothetical protein
MIHKITIPYWRPAALNTLMRSHWSTSGKLKKSDANIISAYAFCAGIPKATGKRRVSLEITLTGLQRQTDPDSYQKSTLDGLVKCGMLLEDNAASVEWGGVSYDRIGEAKTTIVLEDL